MTETLGPLLIRPGSRYRCFGDGLCCSDIHAVGPLTDQVVARLAVLRDDAVQYSPLLEANVLTTLADGQCAFRTPEGCGLHVRMEGALKPIGCWRYPLGITATPRGARVVLEHRCPCTLMGDRPLLTEDKVRDALERGGGLMANHRLTVVSLTDSDDVPYNEYVDIERVLLDKVERGDLLEALEAEPFPALQSTTWDSLAEHLLSTPGGGRFETAVQWFGEGLLSRGGKLGKPHPRPWADAFDRAEARTPEPGDAMAPFRVFVADAIWSLFWTDHGSMLRKRQELATRLCVGRAIAAELEADGVRADRAAAEAVMVLDLVGTTDWWTAAVMDMT